MEDGSSVSVGMIRLSTHTATHVDAPLHYLRHGHAVDAYDLGIFVGPALVWEAPDVDLLRPEHLESIPPSADRLLVKTRHSFVPDETWSDAFMAFHPDTIRALADRGIVLIGTDTPSYDPADSKNLPAHHALAACRIANLENLSLRSVAPGEYTLLALPMALAGMDAAPVRAVLIDSNQGLHINVTATD